MYAPRADLRKGAPRLRYCCCCYYMMMMMVIVIMMLLLLLDTLYVCFGNLPMATLG